MVTQAISNSNNLYGNILVKSPDGTPMFYSGKKRVDWYLNKGLADIVSEDPYEIQLNFQPKGKGNDSEFYLSKKDNICVGCGGVEELTKHHVVPYLFRKFYPDNIKGRSSHDVVLLCVSCHQKCNVRYSEKIKNLEIEIGISLNGNDCEDVRVASEDIKNATALLYHGDKMPEEKIAKMNKRLCDRYFIEDINRRYLEEILRIAKEKKNSKNNKSMQVKKFVESIIERYSIDGVNKMWRTYFIEEMKPSFMPKGWDLNYKRELT